MADWKFPVMGIGLFPSPIVGHAFIVDENQINLPWIWRSLATVDMVGTVGDTTVASPAVTRAILVFIPSQPLKNGCWSLKDHGHNEGTLLGVAHAPLADSLHSVVGNQHFAGQRAVPRVDRLQRDEITARTFPGSHNFNPNNRFGARPVSRSGGSNRIPEKRPSGESESNIGADHSIERAMQTQ
jgi:hypothetical protein